MAKTLRTEILGYGVRAFTSRHLEIRKLKRIHTPSVYGFRIWTSSWLLMDYFKHRGLRYGTRVMDVGCGWGLAGIYCARKHNAIVTGVDIDSEVFPYLRIHANINNVEIETMNKAFDELTCKQLEDVDVLIGADICFWEAMVDPLKKLVCRALQNGVQMVVIADPGRSTFYELGEFFTRKGMGEFFPRAVQIPHTIEGQILRIMSFTGSRI